MHWLFLQLQVTDFEVFFFANLMGFSSFLHPKQLHYDEQPCPALKQSQ